jgi:hypothetical protein
MVFVIYLKCRKCENWYNVQGLSTLKKPIKYVLVSFQQTKLESETESKNQGFINSQLNLTKTQHISTINEICGFWCKNNISSVLDDNSCLCVLFYP